MFASRLQNLFAPVLTISRWIIVQMRPYVTNYHDLPMKLTFLYDHVGLGILLVHTKVPQIGRVITPLDIELVIATRATTYTPRNTPAMAQFSNHVKQRPPQGY